MCLFHFLNISFSQQFRKDKITKQPAENICIKLLLICFLRIDLYILEIIWYNTMECILYNIAEVIYVYLL